MAERCASHQRILKTPHAESFTYRLRMAQAKSKIRESGIHKYQQQQQQNGKNDSTK